MKNTQYTHLKTGYTAEIKDEGFYYVNEVKTLIPKELIENTADWKKNNHLILKTEDNLDLYEGDNLVFLNLKNFEIGDILNVKEDFCSLEEHKYFASKLEAEKFLMWEVKHLSLNDVFDIFNTKNIHPSLNVRLMNCFISLSKKRYEK